MSRTHLDQRFYIPKVAIIGLGLIGCSWVKALKLAGAVNSISGYDRNLDSMQQALQAGLIEDYSLEITDVVKDADLVIISVPILAVASVLEQIKSAISDKAILTDVGSVKGCVAQNITEILGADFERFVLGHPIAGSERSGVSAADENLFKHHKIILTPERRTSERALDLVADAWNITGAVVELMSVQHHDEVLAATSHLPHLLAYSLVDTLANSHENKDIFNYAAGGFRDFTRIASSSPIMWRDIFVGNKEEVLKALDLFTADLQQLREVVASEDKTQMMGTFTRAKAARDHFTKILARRAYVESMTSQTVNYVAKPGG
ncbi:bifunctional prephenate dehydrogenase/3-phosphoshikimate 1-carboxyvinyltransferase, partial [Oleispira antarctica]